LDFKWDTARKYTVYSYASSCRVGLQNWTCYWCKFAPPSQIPPVKVAAVFESDGVYGTYGYVGVTSQEILVAFRGSASIQNWIHDFEFFKGHFPGAPAGAEVHHGFYTAYTAVQTIVRTTVTRLVKENPHLPLTVTGHSLGAALSVLCSIDIAVQNIIPGEKITVINLGLPRVGNKIFADFWDKTIGYHRRMVNQRDIVPHLPPIVLGFYHINTEIWFPTNTTTFEVCNGSGEDPHCSDSLDYWSTHDHVTYTGIEANAGSACCQCGGLLV